MIKVEDSYDNAQRRFFMVKNYICDECNELEDFGIIKSNNDYYSVYIVQDPVQKDLAYRICKNYKNEHCNEKQDVVFIQRLYENGYKIQDIDFPYGVLTKNNRVIGQAIPYYDEALELDQCRNSNNIGSYVKQAYSYVDELYQHHIYYLDIHESNFLVTASGLKLIDFDREMTRFRSSVAGVNELYERHLIANFRRMCHSLIGDSDIDMADTMTDLRNEVYQLDEEKPKIKIK